jgi:hypothetical protein
MANKVNKKTRKREKQLKKVKQLVKVSDHNHWEIFWILNVKLTTFIIYMKFSGWFEVGRNCRLKLQYYMFYDVD